MKGDSMVERSRRWWWVWLCLLLMVPAGCFTITTVQPVEGLDDLRELQAEERTTARRPRGRGGKKARISVQLDVADQLGCVLERNPQSETDEAKPEFVCTGFAITAADAEEQIDAKGEEVDGAFAVHVEGFAALLRGVLQDHLSQHFARAKVRVASSKKGPPPTAVQHSMAYAQTGRLFGHKIAVVKLFATCPEGRRISVTGEGRDELGEDNLWWYVPMAVLLAPIGSTIGRLVLDGMDSDALELSFAQAADDAAEQLARALVTAARASPNRAGRWTVRARVAFGSRSARQ